MMGENKRALLYLSNHSDNIRSVKFFKDNLLISTCDCGVVTIWNLSDKRSVGKYKVSNHSAFYASAFDKEQFFVKTKEGSVKLWNLNYDYCVMKLDTNNFSYAKPYCVNGNIVTPINHDGDIAICDMREKHDLLLHTGENKNIENKIPCKGKLTSLSRDNKNINCSIEKYAKSKVTEEDVFCNNKWDNLKTGNNNKLVIHFDEIKKKVGQIKILSFCEKQHEYKHVLNTDLNLKLCNNILDIYPVPFFGETYMIACYEPSVFFIYDFRMTNQFVSSFMIDVKENVLSYHINKNNCLVSTNNGSVYSLLLDQNEQTYITKKAHTNDNMDNIVIRADSKIFISTTNNCTINICDLSQMKKIDYISTYKFNYFNFLDFHPFSGFFAAAERNKISLWVNHALSFELPKRGKELLPAL
ncbi:hypothetical protein, conserved [Plasmodium gonderi]|uniref:Uncharacterized protein n=1 Tax=Plasmodium gonderi TaxID=77519 RepID=A0A1Y1JGG0_PLAGO|nr:hypothetical protein, conserved [Plasmodium gonderi]GAW81611.1 hypothetical protein, conserved [Plasmodium gonderi]